jgi:membrane protein YqaA with SNARE-associated domain
MTLIDLFQTAMIARRRSTGFTATLRHLGAFGLFWLAVLDSTPLPTFGGPDILTAILSATHRNPWYEYAIVATAGSVVGAYLTYRMARRAGAAYLNKFGRGRVKGLMKLFQQHGTSTLATSTAVPFPFPTGVLFAVAGVSGYDLRTFLIVVTLCRAARYSLIAILADHYGRHFVRLVRHPDRYWGWLLLIAAIVAGLIAAGILVNRKIQAANEVDDGRELATSPNGG